MSKGDASPEESRMKQKGELWTSNNQCIIQSRERDKGNEKNCQDDFHIKGLLYFMDVTVILRIN